VFWANTKWQKCRSEQCTFSILLKIVKFCNFCVTHNFFYILHALYDISFTTCNFLKLMNMSFDFKNKGSNGAREPSRFFVNFSIVLMSGLRAPELESLIDSFFHATRRLGLNISHRIRRKRSHTTTQKGYHMSSDSKKIWHPLFQFMWWLGILMFKFAHQFECVP
jgi:hypothetical protein